MTGKNLHRTGNTTPIIRPAESIITRGNHKLTEEEILEIRHQLRNGLFSTHDIAKQFNCTPSNIGYILSGKIHNKTPEGRDRSPLRRVALEVSGRDRPIPKHSVAFKEAKGIDRTEDIKRIKQRKVVLNRESLARKTPEELAIIRKKKYEAEKKKINDMTPEQRAEFNARRAEVTRKSRERKKQQS